MDEESKLEREKFEFEKPIRERELALKENEARFGAQILRMLPPMVPLFVVLVASYFAYEQFVQTQQYAVQSQARAAFYTAATEQYKVVLEAKKDLIKRKDTALDTVDENIKTIRGLIDGPEFINNASYRAAKRQFYVIESSVMPFIKTPELTEAVGLFERGMIRTEHIVRKSGQVEAYDSLNADWKTLQKRADSHATVLDLPQNYADMMGYLASGVAGAVEQAHTRNVDPDQFGTVKEIFDRTPRPILTSP